MPTSTSVSTLSLCPMMYKLIWLAELQITEATKMELYLKQVNGTYVDLTLHCVGELKSQPAWKHNGTTVVETVDTVLNTVVNTTSRRRTLIMSRHDVAEHFAGHYQCVDTAFFQSDSDSLTIHHPNTPVKSLPARKHNGTTAREKGRPIAEIHKLKLTANG